MQVCVRMCKCVRASSRAVKSIDLFVWSIRKLICGRGWKTTPKLNLGSDIFLFVESFISVPQTTENSALCLKTFLFLQGFSVCLCVCRRWSVVGRSWTTAWRMSFTFVVWTPGYLFFSWSATLWWRSATQESHRYTHMCTHAHTHANWSWLANFLSDELFLTCLITQTMKTDGGQIAFNGCSLLKCCSCSKKKYYLGIWLALCHSL